MKTSAGIYFNRPVWVALLLGALLLLGACSSARHEARTHPSHEGYARTSKGMASWYGPGFHGKLTASGEPYNMYALTCAHQTLPLGTKLRVTNVLNGESVLLTVNDRGPFVKDRIIDLSYAAAKKLDVIGPGTAKVRLEVLGRDAKYVKYIKAYSVPGEDGPFTVQVASFTDRFNALHLMKGLKLKYRNREPYVFEAGVNGKRHYRVRLGKFGTRHEAKSLAGSLADDGYTPMVCAFEEQI